MTVRFLDTNVILRHLLNDDSAQSTASTAFLSRVQSGETRVRITDTVVFETVFTLERSYRIPKADICESVLPLMEMPGVILPGKRAFRLAFALYLEKNLPFADAFHAATMERLGIDEIVTYDRDFDRVPGVRRAEPADVP